MYRNLIAAVLWLVVTDSLLAVPMYAVTELGPGVVPMDITNNGAVLLFGDGSVREHSVWKNGIRTPIGWLPSAYYVLGLNQAEQVAGAGFAGGVRPFSWESGSFTYVVDPDYRNSYGLVIAEDGTIGGFAKRESDDATVGFLWDGGATLEVFPEFIGKWVYGINDTTVLIVQDSDNAFLWDRLSESIVADVSHLGIDLHNLKKNLNSQGWLLGTTDDVDPLGTLWPGSDDDVVLLPSPGWDLNNGGDVVANYLYFHQENQVWDFDDILAGSGYEDFFGWRINDNRWIVGTAKRDGVKYGLLLRPVPEPSTFVLIAVALAGLSVVLRHRKQ
jgi:hypothetical protein